MIALPPTNWDRAPNAAQNDVRTRIVVGTRFYRVRDLSIWRTNQSIADAMQSAPYGFCARFMHIAGHLRRFSGIGGRSQ